MITSLLDGHLLRLLAYAMAVGACIGAASESRDSGRRRLWLVLASLVLVMGLTRLFGWDNDIADRVRSDAYRGGWYTGRRPVQEALVAGTLACGVVIFGVTLILVRAARGFRATGVAAAAALCSFVAVRAISLHAVDHALFADTTLGVQRSALIELGLVGVLAASALLDVALVRRSRPSRVNPAAASRIGGSSSTAG